MTLHDFAVAGMFDAVGVPLPGHLHTDVALFLVCNWNCVIGLSD